MKQFLFFDFVLPLQLSMFALKKKYRTFRKKLDKQNLFMVNNPRF